MDELIGRLRERVWTHPESLTPVGSATIRARPPATADQLRRSEEQLGFRLPLLLQRVYLEVGNGGFGPDYGIIGIDGGFTDDLGNTAVGSYLAMCAADPKDPAWTWPIASLPFGYSGCTLYSVAVCDRESIPVVWADPGQRERGEPMDSVFAPQRPSLARWLADWLDGKDLWREAELS